MKSIALMESLTSLNLSDLNVTDTGLIDALRPLSNLVQLNLLGCHLLTQAALTQLEQDRKLPLDIAWSNPTV